MSQDAEDEVIINVTEDSDSPASVNDELDEYTKKVSKRINKEKVKVREAEERVAQLAHIAQQKDQELSQFKNIAAQQQVTVLAKEEEALKSKEAQVDDIYQKAVASGDGELMSKATSLKNDVSIQKDSEWLAIVRTNNKLRNRFSNLSSRCSLNSRHLKLLKLLSNQALKPLIGMSETIGLSPQKKRLSLQARKVLKRQSTRSSSISTSFSRE